MLCFVKTHTSQVQSACMSSFWLCRHRPTSPGFWPPTPAAACGAESAFTGCRHGAVTGVGCIKSVLAVKKWCYIMLYLWNTYLILSHHISSPISDIIGCRSHHRLLPPSSSCLLRGVRSDITFWRLAGRWEVPRRCLGKRFSRVSQEFSAFHRDFIRISIFSTTFQRTQHVEISSVLWDLSDMKGGLICRRWRQPRMSGVYHVLLTACFTQKRTTNRNRKHVDLFLHCQSHKNAFRKTMKNASKISFKIQQNPIKKSQNPRPIPSNQHQINIKSTSNPRKTEPNMT